METGLVKIGLSSDAPAYVEIFTLDRTTISKYVKFCNDIQHF
jgi:hypothetical protein